MQINISYDTYCVTWDNYLFLLKSCDESSKRTERLLWGDVVYQQSTLCLAIVRPRQRHHSLLSTWSRISWPNIRRKTGQCNVRYTGIPNLKLHSRVKHDGCHFGSHSRRKLVQLKLIGLCSCEKRCLSHTYCSIPLATKANDTVGSIQAYPCHPVGSLCTFSAPLSASYEPPSYQREPS